MDKLAVGGLIVRLRTWFPDREFFMRSQGQVRFIKLSSRLQMTVAATVAALAAVWLISLAAMGVAQYLSARDRLSLIDREAKVVSAESRVSAYRGDLGKTTEDLKRRQDFIEQVTQSHLGPLPQDARAGETVSNSASAAAETVKKVSQALPEAAGLARLEARQLAFVEALTRLADRRSADAEAKLTRLGLSPQSMLAALDDRSAMGGPLLTLSTRMGAIDLLPEVTGIGDYAAAVARSERARIGDTEFRALTLEALIASKRALRRRKDVEHLIELEALLALRGRAHPR